MLRSMYAGISGMKGFQTKLDVIGNNIANVNTSGFKKGRVTFQDMMSQMTSGAQGATDTRGGVNAKQVGLGSQLGTIDNIHTQGFRQSTNNPLDFALEGDGMFVVASDLVPGDLQNSNVSYTRAGNFYLDEEGNIVNPQGLYLMGFSAVETGDTIYTAEDTAGNPITVTINASGDMEGTYIDENGDQQAIEISNKVGSFDDAEGKGFQIDNSNGTVEITYSDDGDEKSVDTTSEIEVNIVEGTTSPINIPENAQSFSIQTNGTVNYIDANGNTRVAGQIALANFSNPAGLQKAGSNLFLNSENAGYTGLSVPETDGVASIVSGALEMSNVDLSEEFTEMITAQRGFQANTRIITTSDEILQELVNLKR
ncbi:flagellar hook-basal body complex protein [Virgibacillus sp. FSP13]